MRRERASKKEESKEFWRDKVVTITGGTGFLGSHVTKLVQSYYPKELRTFSSEYYDLRNYAEAYKSIEGSDIVVHLAADVGGIGYNREHPYELFVNNMDIGRNVVDAAIKTEVKKFVGIGTVCAYPKHTEVPFKEEDLWKGYPEETNAPYGLAKKMLLVMQNAAREQFGFNSIYLLPVNLYGPGDNFNPESSHVIPALIKKFIDAKESGEKIVEVWGTGKATREFLYVEDAARAIVTAAERYNSTEPVNIGNNTEVPIKQLVNMIKKLTGFEGDIFWDITKPDGQPRRKLDTSRAEREFGFVAETTLSEGLEKTIKWYKEERHQDRIW